MVVNAGVSTLEDVDLGVVFLWMHDAVDVAQRQV